MVGLYSLFVWTVVHLLIGQFLLTPISGASVTWSRTISKGSVSTSSPICKSMQEFRRGLVGFETKAVAVKAGSTYIKCSDAPIAKKITNMFSSSSISNSWFSCHGKWWSVGTCGNGAEIQVKSNGKGRICQCDSQDLVIRPCIGNDNWGGSGNGCGSATTTLSITVWDDTPTAQPTWLPTTIPTAQPTWSPSATPTAQPTWSPTATPTAQPTSPSAKPTVTPSFTPTTQPTLSPTATPTLIPTSHPTLLPTLTPTSHPTLLPTYKPTIHADLIDDFDIVDKNGDGFLNYDEIAFAIADTNKDGKLSFEEYETARADRIFVDTTYTPTTTSSTVKYSDDTYLIADFETIDKNGDGFLNYDEVAFAIADIKKDGTLSLEEYEAARRNRIFVDTTYKLD